MVDDPVGHVGLFDLSFLQQRHGANHQIDEASADRFDDPFILVAQ